MRTLVLSLWAAALCLTSNASPPGASKRKITEVEIRAVVQAVQDEIYDYGFEDDYFQIGENVAKPARKWASRTPIYVNPRIEDGEGQAIYELKHYGEIYRLFAIRKDGMVVLDGDPELEFPPTQPSEKTSYMNGDRVLRMKREWLTRSFQIDTEPSSKTVQAASSRQKERTGYSYWQAEVLPNQRKSTDESVPKQ